MDCETVEKEYREYLNTLSISSLRVLGRRKGLPKATAAKKESLVDDIVAILMGVRLPSPRSNRGAPTKQDYLDPAIEERLEEIGKALVIKEPTVEDDFFGVKSPNASQQELPAISGILEIMNAGSGYLRVENARPSQDDVFISASTISALHLKSGDRVSCRYQTTEDGTRVMREFVAVNKRAVGQYEKRTDFERLTPCYPTEKINLSFDRSAFSLRVLDLFAPIGKGQRALIVAPPRTGKTTLIREIASAIECYHGDLKPVLLLINSQPEEVTEIRFALQSAEIFSSDFNAEPQSHVALSRLVLDFAKRRVETGEHVVLFVDSLTKLYRAYESLSRGASYNPLFEVQRFFGSARNLREGGSLTMIATVNAEHESDSRLYDGVRDIFNAAIFLSESLARRRIFPAIDFSRSGTKKEELLLSGEEQSAVNAMRERGYSAEEIFALLKQVASNEELIERFLAGKIKL